MDAAEAATSDEDVAYSARMLSRTRSNRDITETRTSAVVAFDDDDGRRDTESLSRDDAKSSYTNRRGGGGDDIDVDGGMVRGAWCVDMNDDNNEREINSFLGVWVMSFCSLYIFHSREVSY